MIGTGNDAVLCPAELRETRILREGDYECKVWYNYVPEGGFGITPMNCWWGTCEHGDMVWNSPLKAEVKAIDEACLLIGPAFRAAVARIKKLREKVVLT